jgi:hypothetical protein
MHDATTQTLVSEALDAAEPTRGTFDWEDALWEALESRLPLDVAEEVYEQQVCRCLRAAGVI